MQHKAVFLDRDKTLIEDPGYLSDPKAVKLLPGVPEALRILAGAGYKLIVVSNQSAIARGLLTEAGLEAIHAELRRQLAAEGVQLDAIYFCPYHPDGTVPPYNRESDERKPNPGMLLRAAREHDIDLSQSWMIGDRLRDVEAGKNAGVRTIYVPPPEEEIETGDIKPDYLCNTIAEAARLVVGEA